MISVCDVTKSFNTPPTKVLKGLSFEIKDGDFISITGRSGSGKSTLLYVISTLDNPTTGQVSFDGKNLEDYQELELHEFRNSSIGFVFQFHYLIPELNTLENILLPARKNKKQDEKRAMALTLLKEFGLSGRENHMPSQLSGGEQQRAAIARALVMNPKYLFADEPTGNLDSTNGDIVMNIFDRVNKEFGTTIVFVTHDETYAKLARRRIILVDGSMA